MLLLLLLLLRCKAWLISQRLEEVPHSGCGVRCRRTCPRSIVSLPSPIIASGEQVGRGFQPESNFVCVPWATDTCVDAVFLSCSSHAVLFLLLFFSAALQPHPEHLPKELWRKRERKPADAYSHTSRRGDSPTLSRRLLRLPGSPRPLAGRLHQ